MRKKPNLLQRYSKEKIFTRSRKLYQATVKPGNAPSTASQRSINNQATSINNEATPINNQSKTVKSNLFYDIF